LLSQSEKKYSQIDKEAKAIYWGMKTFFQFCYGQKFELITDHIMPLTRIFQPQKGSPTLSAPRMLHYSQFMSGFHYDIEDQKKVDFLERRIDHQKCRC
jgi:hypothetical protein